MFCNKSYNIKYYYERHVLLCRFLHKSKTEKQIEMEPIDSKMTENQSNKLMINILYEFEKMKGEMKKMKDEIRLLKRRQKIHLEQWLNSSNGPIPEKTWREWFQTIPVSNKHLEIIFTKDLLSGIMECLKDAIEIYDKNELPFCAFIQKQNTLYMYDKREKTNGFAKWFILSKEDIQSILHTLSHRFLQLFLKYEPKDINQWNENEMMYSRKVMGKDTCENTRANSVKEYLYSSLKRNFIEFEII